MYRNAASRLQCALTRFRGDSEGNIAVIFAITLVPLLGFVGAGVDYSRASAAKTAMQGALDSAILMVSKDASRLSASEVTTQATRYFNALYKVTVTDPAYAFTFNPASGGKPASVTGTASGDLQTSFMGIMGFPKLRLNVVGATEWSSSRMRVALALDNTGSMDTGGKMPALKTAAKNLVTTLKNTAGKDGDVYISVVPFAKDVNVGPSFYGENWIDWTDWNNDSGNKTCSFSWSGYTCTLKAKSTWNGCVTDRTLPNDVTVVPATSTATKFPAEQYDFCPEAILPMTYKWSDVTDKINDMQPSGGTNQPIGLVWAWWTLTNGVPFPAPPKEKDYDYIDAIVLLTDGENTQNRWPSYGDGQRQTDGKIDARQKILCDNIKAAKIVLYTIQVNTDGGTMQTVLPYCASTSEKFYNLTSSNQIGDAFVSIGASLVKLRLSK